MKRVIDNAYAAVALIPTLKANSISAEFPSAQNVSFLPLQVATQSSTRRLR